MKILVINLDSENKRMAFQRTQMQRLGLGFERLAATTVKDIDAQEISNRAIQWERPMRKSEVACLFSHRAAWQIIADGSEPVLVLEDDALLSLNVPDILASLEQSNSLDHVTLEIRGRKKLLGTKPLSLNESTNLARLYQDRTGAAAYILWPQGARILLKNSDHAAGLADAIIAAAYEMSSWQIEPAAAMQLDQCDAYGLPCPLDTATTIATPSNEKPPAESLFSSLKFKWRRIVSQLRMGLRQLSKTTKARRRLVAVEIKDFLAHISE